MKTLRFLLPLTLFALIIASCGKEDLTVDNGIDVDQLFTQYDKDRNLKLNGDEIDALLIADYGYVETDYEKKSEQLFAAVNKRINISDLAKGRETGRTLASCTFQETFLSLTSNGLTTGGTICEEDLLLNSLVFGVFDNGAQVLAVDGEVFDLGQEIIATAFVERFGPDGATLLFGAVNGSISTLNSLGNVGTTVIGKQFNRNNLFCDPDDFGDGLRLQSRTRITNTSVPNQMNYTISLSILCKD
ncbi:MAG: hypothetical protein AAF985_02780 [Bacteroidota bacterium]